MDIEGSEWGLFEELCAAKGSGQQENNFLFDQLLIELHGASEANLEWLLPCLERRQLYPFSREENLHSAVCGRHVTGIFDVEVMENL